MLSKRLWEMNEEQIFKQNTNKWKIIDEILSGRVNETENRMIRKPVKVNESEQKGTIGSVQMVYRLERKYSLPEATDSIRGEWKKKKKNKQQEWCFGRTHNGIFIFER